MIAEVFREGGVFMYFILAFGLSTLWFVCDRVYYLYFKLKPISPEFRNDLLQLTSQGRWSEVKGYVESIGESPIGRIGILGSELRSRGCGGEELQARLDERLSEEISAIDKKTSFLAMFGNVATLLGLLGTISGMIHSFGAVAIASPMDRSTLLSKGISEAMNCTAFGLIVAIIALVAYAILQNRTDKIITKLTETATQIYHDLLFLDVTHAEEKSNAMDGNKKPLKNKNTLGAQASELNA